MRPDGHYDLCVAGGGFAGLGAALTAARRGLQTLLIEKDSFWGGTAAVSRHRYLCGLYAGKDPASAVLNEGLSRELESVLRQGGRGSLKAIGEVLVLEYAMPDLQGFFEEEMRKHANLEILTGSEITEVRILGRQISGLEIQGPARREISCRGVIDATGDGAVIFLSGAPFSLAPAEERQLAAYAVQIEGVCGAPENAALQAAYVLAQAVSEGKLARHLKFSPWQPDTAGSGLLSLSVLPSDTGYDLERIQDDARLVHALLQEKLSFFRSSRIKNFAERVAEREGRRLAGEAVLTEGDVLQGRKNGGVKCAWPVEFWDAKKGPQYAYLAEGDYYEIPAGCLRSNTLTNLFAAGRCLSADSRALASARVTAACLATGEAAVHAFIEKIQQTSVRPEALDIHLSQNIAQQIERETQSLLQRPAIRYQNRQTTYEKLFDEVRRLQTLLPIKPYARTGLFLTEGPDTIALSLAVLKLRGVVVPIPPESTPEEVKQLSEALALDALIFEQALYAAGPESVFSSGFEDRRCGVIFFERDWPHQSEFESLNPAFIRFTSGTTGESKGVVLSHETIDARTRAADKGLKISAEDRVLWVLPMTWHFIVTILLFLRRGAEILLCRREIPSGLLEGLKNSPTLIYAAPIHYQAMTASAGMGRETCGSVRLAVSTTAPLSRETRRAFEQKFGYSLTNAYGIIEAGLPFIHSLREQDPAGCAGKPLPDYACRILPEGHVELFGPGFFDAYFSPWHTAQTVMKAGWFRTGDLGCWDAEGNLILQGRDGHVINFMGMKIFPHEIEEVLVRHASVERAHVFGRRHDVYGQTPCARIVLKTGADFQEEALRVFCYRHLPGYKVPKIFEPVERLETTPSGKVKLQQGDK